MAEPPRRPFIAGNWKMNGVRASLAEVEAVAQALRAEPPAARVAVFPPATLIQRAAELAAGSPLEIGAQDAHAEPCGARTGDLSAEQLRDAGATLVILGHSERRTDHREADAAVAAKVEAALRAGLEPVICVGETLEQREAGLTLPVVEGQLHGSLPPSLAGRAFCTAYEPVWAIGTGLTPQTWEVAAVHAALRRALDRRFPGAGAPVLYGGSVKPANAAELLSAEGVGGALVGGASLDAAEFLGIVRAAAAAAAVS